MPTEKAFPRVLVAEDDEVMRLVISRTLSDEEYEVVEVANGALAIERWAEEHFDVFVLDVRMPEMGGPEVMEKIREQDAEVPIILITGDPDLDSARRAVVSRACDYVIKPFPPAELVGKVARVLETRRLEEETRRQQRELEVRYGEILSLQRQQKKLFHLLVGEMFEPLADLKFQIEMISSGLVGALSDQQKEVLGDAEADLERLWKITRDLRDLELLKKENLYQDFSAFDLHEALVESARRGRSLSRGRELEVRVDVDEGVVVHGDRDLVIRAVSSLTCGLIEAGSSQASVSLSGCQKSDHDYEVVVHSTEWGLSSEIWERSFHGEELDELTAAGVSVPATLGLPLSWHIVQAVGGQIGVDCVPEGDVSALAQGTSMTLLLPNLRS